MNLLKFTNDATEQEVVPSILSHLSISLELGKILVKEERGLDEVHKVFNDKEELLDYLKDTL